MYLFSFTKFAGQDRVFQANFPVGQSGDLLKTSDDILLNLGEEIAFAETYTQFYPEQSVNVLIPAFFPQHFLSFLHRMVYWWYSSYKSVIRYFVSTEITDLLMREHKVKVKKKSDVTMVGEFPLSPAGQHLFIFPDNWTRYNTLSSDLLSSPEVLHLASTDTQLRKDLHWRAIKKGTVGPIVVTHSEVFQPYACLKKIVVFDPHKWYYHNQQDPRYALATVVRKMGEIYGAEVVFNAV